MAFSLTALTESPEFNLEPSQNGHIMPFLRNVFGTVPQPLKFWSGYPAPGANKPPEHMKSQGPELVKAYTAEMTDLLGELSPGEASLGAWTMMDWFNSTDGGERIRQWTGRCLQSALTLSLCLCIHSQQL